MAQKWNDLPFDLLAQTPDTGELALLIAEVEAAMAPAGEKAAMIVIDVVAETLQATLPSKTALAIYFKLVGSLPADLLDLATHRVLAEYKYAGLPKPADWLTRVDEELMARQRAVLAGKQAQGRRRIAILYHPLRPTLT